MMAAVLCSRRMRWSAVRLRHVYNVYTSFERTQEPSTTAHNNHELASDNAAAATSTAAAAAPNRAVLTVCVVWWQRSLRGPYAYTWEFSAQRGFIMFRLVFCLRLASCGCAFSPTTYRARCVRSPSQCARRTNASQPASHIKLAMVCCVFVFFSLALYQFSPANTFRMLLFFNIKMHVLHARIHARASRSRTRSHSHRRQVQFHRL